ncbi:MAG: RapZ C-terminal domain-containing protein [Desulforhopalus sp.]
MNRDRHAGGHRMMTAAAATENDITPTPLERETHMAGAIRMRVVLFSFGFKYGAPLDVNLLWDIRFLPNPYWVEKLRPKTGKDRTVADYVIDSEEGRTFLQLLTPLLHYLVKQNEIAGKDCLRIGIGCTGGRHRSVAVVEKIAALMTELPVELLVFHRDVEKDGGN